MSGRRVQDDFDVGMGSSDPESKEVPVQASRDDMVLKSRSFKKAFGYDTDTVLAEKFAASLLESTKNRWAFDRSATADQLAKQVQYSKVRQSELRDIGTRGYIADQYGLKTAQNQDLEKRPGLRLVNNYSTNYNRDIPGQVINTICSDLYKETQKKNPPPLTNYINSEAAFERYQFFYQDDKDFWKTVQLGHGVYAVLPTDKADLNTLNGDGLNSQEVFEKRMQLLGGTPSVFEAVKQKALAKPPQQPAVENKEKAKPKNGELLASITGKGNKTVATLAAVPADHPMKSVANAAVSLVSGLEKALAKKAATEEFKTDPMIANALQAMGAVLNAMPAMLQDSARCLNAYEAMIDELYIVLAAAHPYDSTDFKTAADESLKRRAPVLKEYSKEVESSTYLVSSGMDAITTGWQAAAKLTGESAASQLTGELTPEYFEVGHVFKGSGLGGGNNLLTAVLNPSTPQGTKDDEAKSWDAAKLVKEVNTRLETNKPLVLLLDVTVETEGKDGASDLDIVLKDLKPSIESGDLKLVLAKSYQKYSSLGSGKIMAGSVTVLAKTDDNTKQATEQLTKTESDLDWMQNDEAQLLTHFVAEGGESELEMTRKATENARFAMGLCMGKDAKVKYRDGLPFMLMAAPPLADKSAKVLETTLSEVGSDHRDSFAFLSTSHLLVPFDVDKDEWGQRITPGQESQEEVVEKLWAIGNCMADEEIAGLLAARNPDVAGKIAEQASRVTGPAADDVCAKADLSNWAPAALAILEERMGEDLPKGLKHKLKDLEGSRRDRRENRRKASPSELQFEQELRVQLQTLLKETEPKSGNLLKDQLRVISSAFPMTEDKSARPPVVEGGGDDLSENADLIRARTKPTWKGEDEPEPETRFAPNIIVSCLNLIDARCGEKLAGLTGENLKTVVALYDAALATKLDGVSPGACTRIITGWARLQKGKLENPQTSEEACQALADQTKLLSYREDKAKLLKNCVPDATVKGMQERTKALATEITKLEEEIETGKLGDDSQEAKALKQKQKEKAASEAALETIMRSMFGPLDLTSRVAFIKSLIEAKQYNKAMACFGVFEADLQDALIGHKELLRSEQLTGSQRSGGTAPMPIGESEIGKISIELKGIKTGLELLMNPPPVQPPPVIGNPQPPPVIGNPQPPANATIYGMVVGGFLAVFKFLRLN